VRIGDRVTVDGHPATVVALLSEMAFADGYSPADWAYLETGILVVDDAAGLIHYPDLKSIRISI
jgi:hypothetical protein